MVTPSKPVLLRGWLSQPNQYAERLGALGVPWTAYSGGLQYSLGLSFYGCLEAGDIAGYYAGAAASELHLQALFPDLRARLYGFLGSLLGTDVCQRPGFCGHGLVRYPAGRWCAHHGSNLHADIEGVPAEILGAVAPVLTVVAMLQAPESGGALMFWPATATVDNIELVEPEGVLLAAGDIVAFDSRRLHAVAPFQGRRDRIVAVTRGFVERERVLAWF